LSIIAGVGYVAAVLIYKKYYEPKDVPGVEKKKPHVPSWVKPVAVLHNGFLALLSLIMMIGMGMSYLNLCLEKGWGPCLNAHAGGKEQGNSFNSELGFWFMVFAYSKYLEFFDTYLMMAKRYNLILLHWWHHATVPVLCSIHALERTSSVWTGSIFNCLVHTVMYAYYASAAAGGRWSAKELVTGLQLVQFVTVIGHCAYLLFENGFGAHPWTMISCFTVYSSYLVLFVIFFLETYVYKTAKGAKKEEKGAKKDDKGAKQENHGKENGAKKKKEA